MARQRAALQWTMGSLLLLVVGAAAWSCREEAPEGSSSRAELLPVTPIVACPEGAEVEGAPPPQALRQRCQKSETLRHGASREWYADGRERTYTEWWEGQKHGQFRFWYDNGQVRSEGAHAYGQPAGVWKYYGKDGALKQSESFPTAPPPATWLADALAGNPPAAAPGGEARPDGSGAHDGGPGQLATQQPTDDPPTRSN
jgi:hypothetical protein